MVRGIRECLNRWNVKTFRNDQKCFCESRVISFALIRLNEQDGFVCRTRFLIILEANSHFALPTNSCLPQCRNSVD
jgi:hypothetical protein